MTNEEFDTLVAEAVSLEMRVKEMAAELDAKKDAIRAFATTAYKKASRRDIEMTNVAFDTPSGRVMVAFPKAKAKLRKGVLVGDVVSLQTTVGDVAWTGMFEHRVGFVDTFTDVYSRLPTRHQRLVENLIQWDDATPRVTLPK